MHGKPNLLSKVDLVLLFSMIIVFSMVKFSNLARLADGKGSLTCTSKGSVHRQPEPLSPLKDAARENVPLAQPEHGLLSTVDLNIPAAQLPQIVFLEEHQVSSYSNDGNPLVDGRRGRVEGQEGAERSVGRCHGFWKGISFISTRVKHILRVTKPNTKRATNICPNSLSQIGALYRHTVCVITALQITGPSTTS